MNKNKQRKELAEILEDIREHSRKIYVLLLLILAGVSIGMLNLLFRS